MDLMTLASTCLSPITGVNNLDIMTKFSDGVCGVYETRKCMMSIRR